MADSPFQIRLTLQRLVHSAGSSDELYQSVRAVHPNAKKKDIILGALGVMIDQCEAQGLAAEKLHAFASSHCTTASGWA